MNADHLNAMLKLRSPRASDHPQPAAATCPTLVPEPSSSAEEFRLPARSSVKLLEEVPNPALRNAVTNFDTAGLVKLLLHEVEHVTFKKKRELTGHSDNHRVLEKLLNDMKEMLNHKFLNVDLQNSVIHDVNESTWSLISAVRRSEAGTTGIYFIQLEHPRRALKNGNVAGMPSYMLPTSVIVAKPIQFEEFARHQLVNQIATDYFHIRCPRIRLIAKSSAEYDELISNVKRLFSNLEVHRDMYDNGGKSSPKDLFTTNSILLMELVKGSPLCHRLNGQRELAPIDYRAVGRLFLLDLLIRNTDRLPCRKAMPRPGSSNIADQGNAGNLMFGNAPGTLWAIDPEMQTQISQEKERSYLESFHGVVNEIVHSYHNSSQFKTLSKLFFERVDFLEGILDASLDETTPWDTKSEIQQHGIDAVLQLIRVRAAAYDNFIVNNSTHTPPPDDNNEKAWREWIRMAVPRAVFDVVEFIEAHTGYVAPPSALTNVETGFLEAMAATRKLRLDLEDPFKLVGSFQRLIQMAQNPEQGVAFIIRLVKSLERYDSFLPDVPQQTCDEIHTSENGSSNAAVSTMFLRRKKLLKEHVHKIGHAKLLEAKQQLQLSAPDTVELPNSVMTEISRMAAHPIPVVLPVADRIVAQATPVVVSIADSKSTSPMQACGSRSSVADQLFADAASLAATTVHIARLTKKIVLARPIVK
jgi:hypothetical protein